MAKFIIHQRHIDNKIWMIDFSASKVKPHIYIAMLQKIWEKLGIKSGVTYWVYHGTEEGAKKAMQKYTKTGI